MGLRLEAMPDNPRRAAIFYGPILLAGDLGPVELTAETTDVSGGPRVPVLVTEDRPPRQWLRRRIPARRDWPSAPSTWVGPTT